MNKEDALLNQLTDVNNLNQRQLSQKTGLSLGSVNLALKRMINKGLVKTKNLSGRSLQYIITPKGFEEKLKKTFRFIKRTLADVQELELKISTRLDQHNLEKYSNIALYGDDELRLLVSNLLNQRGITYKTINRPRCKHNELLINCSNKQLYNKNEIFLAKEL
ncbi:MAG TPA: winged helix-turn-helix transcriptional regulator [Spirochaetota bacterium]|nr:winged helix-turn-helix transcriptional regulator [Spirochaetota bacterium]